MSLVTAEARELRKDRILAAASVCFARLGLQGTRVEDILQEAGISRATFYRHFENTDAILMRLTVRAARDMMALAVSASIKAESDKVRRLARVIAEMVARPIDPPILALIAESSEMLRLSNLIMLSSEHMVMLTEPLLPLLEDAVANGALRGDMSIDRMVEWLTRNSTSIRYRLPPWASTVSEFEEYVMEFVMPPLLPARPQDIRAVVDQLGRIEALLRTERTAPR